MVWYEVGVRNKFCDSLFFLVMSDSRLTMCGGSERQDFVCRHSAFKYTSATRLRRNPSLATNSSRTSAMSRETTAVGVREGSERRER